MNSRAFSLSLIIAGIAMFMVYSYMEGRESLYIQKYGKESPVVIAKVDIKELDIIDDTKVTKINVPQTFLAPGHIKDPKEVFNTIATVPILKGEQITQPRITFPGSNTGLSRQISLGKRAFSISVDITQSVSRLIKPGDRVDVVARMDFASGKKDLIKIKTILQDVLVLSTGMSITNAVPLMEVRTADNSTRKVKLNTYTDYTTVTLELDPFQVQKMVFLVTEGTRPYLALKNNDDKKIVRIKSSRYFDLLGEDAADAKTYFSTQK